MNKNKGKLHHITIKGVPLCECEGHNAGLLSQAINYDHLGEALRLTCTYRSKARARSAWREVVKHRYWKAVKVVPGSCQRRQS